MSKIDKKSYERLFREQIETAERVSERVNRKMDKLRNQLMGKAGDEEWFTRVDYSSTHINRKC